MIKKQIVIILLLLPTISLATTQFKDIIYIHSKEYQLNRYLMESYFEKIPKKRPKGEMCSALWRGYLATFEFKEDVLLLKDIQILDNNNKKNPLNWKSVLNEIVPEGENLTIDWFTGFLEIPHGKQENPFSNHSNYILLEITKGKLTDRRDFTHEQFEEFKVKQFNKFKKTEDYNALLKNLSIAQQNESHIRKYITYYSTEFLLEQKTSEEPQKKINNQEIEKKD